MLFFFFRGEVFALFYPILSLMVSSKGAESSGARGGSEHAVGVDASGNSSSSSSCQNNGSNSEDTRAKVVKKRIRLRQHVALR